MGTIGSTGFNRKRSTSLDKIGNSSGGRRSLKEAYYQLLKNFLSSDAPFKDRYTRFIKEEGEIRALHRHDLPTEGSFGGASAVPPEEHGLLVSEQEGQEQTLEQAGALLATDEEESGGGGEEVPRSESNGRDAVLSGNGGLEADLSVSGSSGCEYDNEVHTDSRGEEAEKSGEV